jgi:hypothetical protein
MAQCLRGELAGRQSIRSTETPVRLIGYPPRYSWRDPQLG